MAEDKYGVRGVRCNKNEVSTVARSIAVEEWGAAKVTGSRVFSWELFMYATLGPRIFVTTDYGTTSRDLNFLDEED